MYLDTLFLGNNQFKTFILSIEKRICVTADF